MERSLQKNSLINLLALLLASGAGFGAARYAGSLAGQVASVYLGLGMLVAVVSWFHIRLIERERLERLEFDELAKGKGGGASLFESKEAEVFPVRRSREQFERFFIPGCMVLLFLLQAGGSVLLWRRFGSRPMAGPQHLLTGAVFGAFFLLLFILGRFAAAFSRQEESRLLRPAAGYLLLSAYLSAVVALGFMLVWLGYPAFDFYIAKALSGLLAVIAAETLLTLVLEIYRPRIKGKAARPLYESRLVSLLGQPEGLLTTAAQTLDYQFGFKVSETWFYRFLEQALGAILLLQFGVLLASTCVVFVEPGEQALLERFGQPVAGREVLGPGGHLKLPWPIDETYRYRTDQFQSFVIGLAPGEAEERARVVLWTVGHGTEENFLVANREQRTGAPSMGADTNAVAGKGPPPVSLLVVSVPVQYQITNLLQWAYQNADPATLFQQLAAHEVVKFLVSVDTAEFMSEGRLAAAATLRQRIQEAANARQLGARIAFVGLEDTHPPVQVAQEYESVIGALLERQAAILSAQTNAIMTNALAQAQATTLLNQASADRKTRETTALAQAVLFTNQVVAWKAAPAVYAQRAYLKKMPDAIAGARKYLLLATNSQQVIQFDLQDSIASELLQRTYESSTQPK